MGKNLLSHYHNFWLIYAHVGISTVTLTQISCNTVFSSPKIRVRWGPSIQIMGRTNLNYLMMVNLISFSDLKWWWRQMNEESGKKSSCSGVSSQLWHLAIFRSSFLLEVKCEIVCCGGHYGRNFLYFCSKIMKPFPLEICENLIKICGLALYSNKLQHV